MKETAVVDVRAQFQSNALPGSYYLISDRFFWLAAIPHLVCFQVALMTLPLEVSGSNQRIHKDLISLFACTPPFQIKCTKRGAVSATASCCFKDQMHFPFRRFNGKQCLRLLRMVKHVWRVERLQAGLLSTNYHSRCSQQLKNSFTSLVRKRVWKLLISSFGQWRN